MAALSSGSNVYCMWCLDRRIVAADVQQLIEGGGGAAPAPSQEAPAVSPCTSSPYFQQSSPTAVATHGLCLQMCSGDT